MNSSVLDPRHSDWRRVGLWARRATSALSVCALALLPVVAAASFSTDFSTDPAGSFAAYTNTTVFDWDSGNQQLHAERGDAVPYAGFYQLTNAAAVSLADVTLESAIRVTIGTPNNDYAVIGGLQARITPGAGSYTSGYYAVLGRPSWDQDDPTLRLYLGRDIGSVSTAVSMGALLATGTYSAAAGTTYRLIFSLAGTNLTAQLWDAAGTTLLDAVSAQDAVYAQGNVGYLAALRSGSTEYHFDDFSLAPIPEPSAALLLLTGGLALVRRRRG